MAYKVLGTTTDSCRIYVINESNWSVESTKNVTAGDYEVDSLSSGNKTIVGRRADGQVEGFGAVTPILYDTWANLFSGGSVPSGRRYLSQSMASYGNYIYMFGGLIGSPYGRSNELYRYDIVSNTWLLLSAWGSGVQGASLVEYNGKLYKYGGYANVTNAFYVFDIATSGWTTMAGGPLAVGYHGAAICDGKMYIYGGRTSSGRVNILYEYNIATNTWLQKADGPGVRDFPTLIEYNGYLYMFGGDSNGSTFLKDTWRYNPNTNNWTQLANCPGAGRREHTAIEYDGKMYIFGGWHNTYNYLNDLWEYNIATNSWQQKSSHSVSRCGHGATILEDIMYIFGGYNGTYLNDTWSYSI